MLGPWRIARARTSVLWARWSGRVALALVVFFVPVSCTSQGGARVQGHSLDEFYPTDAAARALAAAAARGDTAAVPTLVHQGADPNAPGREGMLPLLWALTAQNKPGVRALLAAGADPNRRNGAGPSPLALVTGARDPELLAILLAHGGDPNGPGRDGRPLLFQAVQQHKADAIQVLAAHGADLNGRARTGQTPVLLAATLNQTPLVRELLELGAAWDVQDLSGGTLAYYVQDANVEPQFREAYAAQEWARHYLEARGVRFPVPTPWEARKAAAAKAAGGGA